MAATLWLAAPSRYAGWPAARARAVLAILAALILICTLPPWPAPPPGPVQAENKGSESDLALYEAISASVGHGGDYYETAAREMRARAGYPLRPFVTVRLPTLAVVQGHLPHGVNVALLFALAAATSLTWLRRLFDAVPQPAPRIVAAFLLAAGMIVFVQTELIASHEVWAALLIAWSLGVRRHGRWVEAVALAVAAMLIRELAVVYGLVMVLAAAAAGQRREAAGWAAGLCIVAVAVVAHAWAVGQVTSPVDLASSGWSGLHGIRFFAITLKHATVLEVFPYEPVAPLVALALFGWTAWATPLGTRVAATIAAFGLLIGIFARHNNFYWGMLAAPLLLCGLLFVPDALRDLWRSARGRRRVTVTRVAR